MSKRLHIKSFQNDQYKVADKRIHNAIKRATMALTSNYNNPSLRLFGGIRRFSWL